MRKLFIYKTGIDCRYQFEWAVEWADGGGKRNNGQWMFARAAGGGETMNAARAKTDAPLANKAFSNY